MAPNIKKPDTPQKDGIAKSVEKQAYKMNRTVRHGDVLFQKGQKVSFSDPLTRKLFLINNLCS